MIQKIAAAISYLFLAGAVANGQTDYSNYLQQTNRLTKLSKDYPQLTKLKSIGKTTGGKDIWMFSIGAGDPDSKPAIVVAGGVEGNHLLGMELAIGFAEKILHGSQSDSIKILLSRTSFYVFPNLSPDAMEQYFSKTRYERQGNATTTDDDRDGRINEDGFDDLDADGRITSIRVESPVGEYMIHPEDPRVLVKADLSKGEKGKYLLLSEGIDNDKDGFFNEDGEGGVAINRNLSFKHPAFTAGAGEFAVSENESRALLDNLYQLFNVYAVVSFSSNNNLSVPFTFNASGTTTRVVTGWLEADVKVNNIVSELYNKATKMKDAPKSSPVGGDLLSWAYFHYGRYSFSTPGWFVPKFQPDTSKKEKAITVDDPTINYLRWATQRGINHSFVEWKKIAHPDFPGKIVEIGGLPPFLLTNPPYRFVDSIAIAHTDFMVRLAALQPELDLVDIKTEKLGAGLTRLTVSVINKGVLPSHSKLGERSYWVKRILVKLNTAGNQSLVSGKKIQLLNSLEGLGTKELTWLIRGTGKLVLEAGSPTTGSKKVEINL